MATKRSKKSSNQKQIIGREKQTRIEIFRAIAGSTQLPKVQVESVISALADLLNAHMRKRGSGEFIVPLLGIKVRRIKKKATKARTMLSPLTGQEVVIAGKPARLSIKLTALKPLKMTVLE